MLCMILCGSIAAWRAYNLDPIYEAETTLYVRKYRRKASHTDLNIVHQWF